ncbi:FMN-linked oxidoreductase [Phaeosphaeriaceae sp. SRC1lsM3a]|nr:FMN-linked oxidoreductase [Stagonospora sp. SRC1lsM3a]
MADSRLFKTLKLGSIEIQHRIVMSPLTRFRADDDHVPLPFVTEYYAQRASIPGTLLVTEATYISARHGGYPNAPGIWNSAQIEGWKNVTDAVHAKGSYIFLQLWALGRASVSREFAGGPPMKVLGPSAVPLDDSYPDPHAMTIEEIKETVQEYVQAAKNAIEAGFDGVEIHGANGYLIDQFIQDTTNKRTDKYGGSNDNRSRFAVEVTQAVVAAVGAERTGVRFSPWSSYQGMRMENPIPQFTDLIRKLDTLNIAYLHLVEGRVSGSSIVESADSLNFAFDAFTGPILLAGGFTPDLARKVVDKEHKDRDVAIVFGRFFISTPDLVFRIQHGLELNKYDRNSFYLAKSEKGYVDYPFSPEFLAAQA